MSDTPLVGRSPGAYTRSASLHEAVPEDIDDTGFDVAASPAGIETAVDVVDGDSGSHAVVGGPAGARTPAERPLPSSPPYLRF